MTGAGGEPTSYIALDDIAVKEGGCSETGEGSLSLASSCFPSFRKKKEGHGHSGGGEGTSSGSTPGQSLVSFLLGKVVVGEPRSKVTMGSFRPRLL